MTLSEMLEIMEERLDLLMSGKLKSKFFRDAVPGAIDRLCQKISNVERIQNERKNTSRGFPAR